MATFRGTDSRNIVSGTFYDDVTYGYGGDDDLYGGAGNDYLSGGFGDDYLSGGSGSDRLVGGAGHDDLVGGSGRDVMTGGTGEDAFVFDFASDSQAGFSSRDIITDFALGVDFIDLSGMTPKQTRLEIRRSSSVGMTPSSITRARSVTSTSTLMETATETRRSSWATPTGIRPRSSRLSLAGWNLKEFEFVL